MQCLKQKNVFPWTRTHGDGSKPFWYHILVDEHPASLCWVFPNWATRVCIKKNTILAFEMAKKKNLWFLGTPTSSYCHISGFKAQQLISPMHCQVNAVVWWEWENFRPEPWDKRWPTSVPLGAIWLDFCWPIVGRVFETKSLQDFGYSIAPLLEEVAEKDSTLALLSSENMDDVEQLVFRSGILVDLPGHVAKCHRLISCLLSNVPLRVCWVWMISKHIDLGDTSFSGLKIRHLPMTPQISWCWPWSLKRW